MTNVLNQKSIEAKPVILSGAYFSGVEGPASSFVDLIECSAVF
jgi:hypothetical protein